MLRVASSSAAPRRFRLTANFAARRTANASVPVSAMPPAAASNSASVEQRFPVWRPPVQQPTAKFAAQHPWVPQPAVAAKAQSSSPFSGPKFQSRWPLARTCLFLFGSAAGLAYLKFTSDELHDEAAVKDFLDNPTEDNLALIEFGVAWQPTFTARKLVELGGLERAKELFLRGNSHGSKTASKAERTKTFSLNDVLKAL